MALRKAELQSERCYQVSGSDSNGKSAIARRILDVELIYYPVRETEDPEGSLSEDGVKSQAQRGRKERADLRRHEIWRSRHLQTDLFSARTTLRAVIYAFSRWKDGQERGGDDARLSKSRVEVTEEDCNESERGFFESTRPAALCWPGFCDSLGRPAQYFPPESKDPRRILATNRLFPRPSSSFVKIFKGVSREFRIAVRLAFRWSFFPSFCFSLLSIFRFYTLYGTRSVGIIRFTGIVDLVRVVDPSAWGGSLKKYPLRTFFLCFILFRLFTSTKDPMFDSFYNIK